MIHDLKCQPDPYWSIMQGVKRFEFRKNDRNFQKRDILHLREWAPDPHHPEFGHFTGRSCLVIVSYILSEGFGLPEGYVIMSIGAPWGIL